MRGREIASPVDGPLLKRGVLYESANMIYRVKSTAFDSKPARLSLTPRPVVRGPKEINVEVDTSTSNPALTLTKKRGTTYYGNPIQPDNKEQDFLICLAIIKHLKKESDVAAGDIVNVNDGMIFIVTPVGSIKLLPQINSGTYHKHITPSMIKPFMATSMPKKSTQSNSNEIIYVSNDTILYDAVKLYKKVINGDAVVVHKVKYGVVHPVKNKDGTYTNVKEDLYYILDIRGKTVIEHQQFFSELPEYIDKMRWWSMSARRFRSMG